MLDRSTCGIHGPVLAPPVISAASQFGVESARAYIYGFRDLDIDAVQSGRTTATTQLAATGPKYRLSKLQALYGEYSQSVPLPSTRGP